jgi:multidrug efflux system membrane fusion protein
LAHLSVFAAGLFLLPGCGQKSESSSGEQVLRVRVEKPVVKPVTDYEYFTGRVAAPDSLDVRAKVTGYLVRWNFEQRSDKAPTKDFNFTPGQDVKRDQVLFKIDPRPYQAVYDQAEAQIELAKARLALAQADYKRAMNVAKTAGAISQQDVDKYLASQSEATAEVEAAKANAESAKLNLDFTDVKTDITGVVGRNLLSIGNLVDANTLLTTVVSEDPLYAYFDVDEPTLLRVQQMMREGKLKSVRDGNSEKYPVDLGLSNGSNQYPYTADIDFVNNQVDPTTGTLQVRGVIKNPKPDKGPRIFAPGMFLRVRLPIGGAQPALLVPQAAIGSNQGQKFVRVVTANNLVEFRPIVAGEEQPGGMQVAIPVKIVRDKNGIRQANPGEQGDDSLTANDQVIVGGLQRVRPGMHVEVQTAANETN